ncbi:Fc receptor-like protein 2 isoform X2 [Heptranchias perlo]|uniref:Fc receptor-like protein 2 isoform X2 n=1 Tax=Heptranchias perlo TaxID=212740 RepID=UPI003559D6B6
MKKICLLLIFLQSTPRGTTQAHDPVVVVRYPRSGIVKEGEKFTLQCLHSKKYIRWYKDDKYLYGFSNEFYESRAHSRSGGSYQCETWTPTWRKSKSLEVVTIAHDKILTLEVKPRAALRGQSIFLKCLVSHWVGGRSHVFLWYRNEKLITPTDESECTIENAQDSDEASYRCELKIGDRKWVSPEVDVTITELFSRVTLRADPQAKIFEGQQLKLVCSVETSRPNILLQYTFFKNDQPLNFDSYENDYRTELASLSDSGTYLCEANALLIGVKKKSDQVSVSVKQLFSRVTLRAEPQAQIFEGQQLKLVCSVETLRPNTRLQYSFYKNEQPLNFTSYQNYYRTELASLSDSGTYLCEANALDIGVKKKSDQVSVSVKQIPVSKPQLSISPGKELIEGGTAALTCSVSNGSTPITYIFYKDSNQEFHLEKSDRKGIIYQIAKVNKSTKGNYSCAVSNEGAEFGLHSEFVAVAVIVPVAGAFLTSNTNKTEISAGFRLVLRCLVTEGTEPRFHWYLNDRQLENISESYHLNADGSELIINSFEISHGGRYHCVATNRGKEVGIFNTTSNHIDVTVCRVTQPRSQHRWSHCFSSLC